MGGGPSVPADKHIVVVGGGYGGITLCSKLLAKKANFTLVDSRDAFHHKIAAVRACVVPGFVNKTLISYDQTFGSHFRQGKVVGVDPDNNVIKLEGGDDVSYDVLVFATGSSGPFPGTMGHVDKDKAIADYGDYVDKLKTSGRVVVVGGGAVGVEIAAEIRTEYKDKEVTLIHGGQQLVTPGLSKGMYKNIDNTLGKLGVKIVRGEKVTDMSEADEGPVTVTTDQGSSIEADLVIRCTGMAVNKGAYEGGLGHVLDERGALKVRKSLQVEGYDNIYALGDCCASGDRWMAFLAIQHAGLVLKNMSKKKGESLASHKLHDYPVKIVVSLGRRHAFGELKNGMAIPAFICQKAKAQDMTVAKFWGEMKQKVPA